MSLGLMRKRFATVVAATGLVFGAARGRADAPHGTAGGPSTADPARTGFSVSGRSYTSAIPRCGAAVECTSVAPGACARESFEHLACEELHRSLGALVAPTAERDTVRTAAYTAIEPLTATDAPQQAALEAFRSASAGDLGVCAGTHGAGAVIATSRIRDARVEAVAWAVEAGAVARAECVRRAFESVVTAPRGEERWLTVRVVLGDTDQDRTVPVTRASIAHLDTLEFPQAPPGEPPIPVDLRMRLRIDGTGQVTAMLPAGSSRPYTPPYLEQCRATIRRSTFLPARAADGTGVTSALPFMCWFHVGTATP
jgi:hypothetical protein